MGYTPLSTIQGVILPQTCYSQFVDEQTGAKRSQGTAHKVVNLRFKSGPV